MIVMGYRKNGDSGRDSNMKGHIEKRLWKDGKTVSYFARADSSPDPLTGKRRQQSGTFRTKREAEAAVAGWIADAERGTAADPTRITFGDFLRDWLDAHQPPDLRPTTHSTYTFLAERHIIPALGALSLKKLTAQHLDEFYAAKRMGGRLDSKPGGLSPKTLKHFHELIHTVLDQADRWYNIRNAATRAETPSVPAKKRLAWTAAQARHFLAVTADDWYSPLWLFLLTTGMRRGEALGMRWADIDREAGVATINQTVLEIRGKKYVQPHAKTEASEREVRLSRSCLSALAAHRVVQDTRRTTMGPAWHDHDLVFTTGRGEPILPRNVDRSFVALVEKSGLPAITLHDLRRTHSTLLAAAGIEANIVSERLGHKNVAITLDIYTNVLPEMAERAARAIDGALALHTDTSLPEPSRPHGEAQEA